MDWLESFMKLNLRLYQTQATMADVGIKLGFFNVHEDKNEPVIVDALARKNEVSAEPLRSS